MTDSDDETGSDDENAQQRGVAGRDDADRAAEPARPDVDPSILAAAEAAVRAAGEAGIDGGPDSVTEDAAGAGDAESSDAADASQADARPTSESAPEPAQGEAPGEAPGEDDATPVSVDVADPDAEALGAIPLPVRIEAALFAATEPLPLKRLKEITGCPDGRLLRDTLDVLAASYAEHGRAFRVEEVAQGFQLRTSAEVAVVVQRLGRRATDEKLSTAALETLAVVAYRQPVLRADIERIRGVACGEVLRALQERGLVRAAGRAELPGSPILYGTTQRFLEIFGLRDIQDLPKDREVLRRPD